MWLCLVCTRICCTPHHPPFVCVLKYDLIWEVILSSPTVLTSSPPSCPPQDRFASWSTNTIKVLPVVASGDASWQGLVGSFATAFDADDLEYDPDVTAAVVCGDKQSNAEALKVLEEAGVPSGSIVVWEA